MFGVQGWGGVWGRRVTSGVSCRFVLSVLLVLCCSCVGVCMCFVIDVADVVM